jgi:glycerol-3-phosphate acyltransferase PlsX
MGSIYMENVEGIRNPKVGLINIGAEEEKGNAVVKETYELLKSDKKINFCGNLEARDIPNGDMQVAVCDAFVGNVVLKLMEGFGMSILYRIKREITADVLSKVGAVFAMGAFKRIKKFYEYKNKGGAPFLGLKALVVKAHGSSDAESVKGAISQCVKFIEADIVNKIAKNINDENENS